jgi:hypothetical protein
MSLALHELAGTRAFGATAARTLAAVSAIVFASLRLIR